MRGRPWLDTARGNRLDQPFDHLFPLQRLSRGRGIAVPGAQGGAKRRRIAHFQLKHPRLEHVGHDLQDLAVGRCSASGVDRIDVHLHPAGVTRDRHHLPFDDAAHVALGIIFVKPIAMDARGADRRRDFRLVPRQEDAAVVAGGGRLEQAREVGPGQAEGVAHAFARQ